MIIVADWKTGAEDVPVNRDFIFKFFRSEVGDVSDYYYPWIQLPGCIVDVMRNIPEVELFFAPPALYVDEVSQYGSSGPVEIASQDIDIRGSGVHNNQTTGEMLQDFDVNYAIVGGRDAYEGRESESSQFAKIGAAYDAGIVPIWVVNPRLVGVQNQMSADSF